MIGALTFVIALIALIILVLVPREAHRDEMPPQPRDYPDTAALRSAAVDATEFFADAEQRLARARDLARQPVAPVPVQTQGPLAPYSGGQVDTADHGALELSRAITRAENAPLAASYRELAKTGALRDDPAVKALVDSLAEIERVRDAFGALGGVDPIYVALTGRATVVGRAIQSIALAKRAGLRRERHASMTTNSSPDSTERASAVRRHDFAVADSLAQALIVENARSAVRASVEAFARGRATVSALDQRASRARDLEKTRVQPWALLAAALILAFVCGFTIVFASEVRHPHVGDTGELARLLGVPCSAGRLAAAPPPDRARRRADRDVPSLLSWRPDDYQLLYLQLAAQGGSLLFAAVTGDDPSVTAAVASNLAAAAVRQARTAVVADLDVGAGVVADLLRVRRSPGVREMVTTTRSWAEAIVSAPIGRELVIDIVPAGARGTLKAGDFTASLAPEIARLSRRYDAVVVTCSLEQALSGLAAALPVPDVILCVRAGRTLLRDISDVVEGLRLAGGRLRAGVLWEGESPYPLTSGLTMPSETVAAVQGGEENE